jgi:hypothetical protein
MSQITLDFSHLRETNKLLYQNLARRIGVPNPIGTFVLDVDVFDAVTRLAIYQWLQRYAPEPAASEPEPPKPSTRLTPPRTAAPPEPAEEQIDIEAGFKADLQVRADEASAHARMNQYVVEQNLEPSDHNANAVAGFIRQTLKGYWSAAGVDAAISNLGPRGTNVLRWSPKVAAPPLSPAPAQPAETLGWCSDGKPQLPLQTPQSVLKSPSTSTAQIQDWLKRFRSANGLIYARNGLTRGNRFSR